MTRSLRLLGWGSYLPRTRVDGAELEKRWQLRPGWVARHSGVRHRHWAAADETNGYMGARASRRALERAGLEVGEIDLILNASGTWQQAIPDGAPFVQRELGSEAAGIPGFTIHATCLSFLVALETAEALLERYPRILIVSSELTSVGLNHQDPATATLFGDGAAAMVVCRGEGNQGLGEFRMETYGEFANLTEIRGGGTRLHPNAARTVAEDNLFSMEGPKVARMAVTKSLPFLEALRPGTSTALTADWVVPHQTSKLGLSLLTQFGWPVERTLRSLEKYGNCVAASIPLTLVDALDTGRVKKGEEVLLFGTGAGLSVGGLFWRL